MPISPSKIAVVTGANRGIGKETARQLAAKGLHVILCSRDLQQGAKAQAELADQGVSVDAFELDVTKQDQIERLVAHVRKTYSGLGVLVNNAGVLLDGKRQGEDVFKAKVETIAETMQSNVYGPFLLCQGLIPLMQAHGYGRVVNVSSGMGGLTEMNGGYPGYRISKAALNVLTRIFTAATNPQEIKVNSVCPGWVKTEMGGAGATRSIQEGAQGIVWAATLPADGPHGGFFRDGKPLAW